MANQTLGNVKILLRNDTAANWTTENPVLGKGELGIEIDTAKFKIGDGVTAWSSLDYAGTVVAASATNGHITIDGTDTTVYTLPVGASAIGGVKTTSSGAGTVAIDSAGAMALNNSGVTAGTYTKVTVGANGIVTAGTDISASDIPSITLSKISDAGTAASKNTGTSSGNVPVLDSNGKLDTAVLPPLAVGTAVTVADDTARFALTTADVQNGDVVNVTGTNKSYFVIDDTKLDVEAGYSQILVPAGGVQSVNNKTGVVTLDTDDIAEGSNNLYWTSNRFDTAFSGKASTSLTDGANIIKTTDTLTIDCGNA